MTEPKTATVRIAVAVDQDGDWAACGAIYITDEEMMGDATYHLNDGAARYWVTATLPIPEPQEISGTVEAAGDA